MKAWRKEATLMKREAVKRGTHEVGRRYGRLCKAVMSSVSIRALPSQLFVNIGTHAGIFAAAEPQKELA